MLLVLGESPHFLSVVSACYWSSKLELAAFCCGGMSSSEMLDVLLVAQAELNVDGVDEQMLEDLVLVLGECDVFTAAELRLAFCTGASQVALRVLLVD